MITVFWSEYTVDGELIKSKMETNIWFWDYLAIGETEMNHNRTFLVTRIS
jgi:hypothetical protein